MPARVLGIDVGTGGTRALIVADNGRILASATEEHEPFSSPKIGWAEQRPEDWWRAAGIAVRRALAQSNLRGDQTVSYTHLDVYKRQVWSPNINIFRDPRWGRGQETYGEDPFLTARMGVAFVTGLQGNDPKYLKTVATPKHFAVHSGPESTRHTVDVQASRHDMEDTYFPAFRAAVDVYKRQGSRLLWKSTKVMASKAG